MDSSSHPVVILGAGLSGLSLAWVLKSLSIPYIILEKENNLGGVIQGENLENFQLDLGPQTFMLEAELSTLIDHLGLENKLSFPSPTTKSKFIGSLKKNYLKEVSNKPFSLLSQLILQPKDLLYIFKDLFIKKASKKELKDISIYDLSLEILGTHITEELFAPAMLGIWATDLKYLSAKSIYPAMYKAYIEGTSIIKAQLKSQRKKNQNRGKAKLATLEEGLSSLINSLSESIGLENIIRGVEIQKINLSAKPSISYRHADGTKEILFSTLVSSIPSYELEKLLPQSNLPNEEIQSYCNLLDNITYSPIGILHSKIKNTKYPDQKSGFGLLVPPGHCKSILGTIFTSEMFKEKAPKEYTLFTSFIGGSIYPDKADVRESENAKLALEELQQILKLQETPELLKATYWPKAIPQYRVGHEDLVKSLTKIEKKYPLLLHGNFLDGTSIPHQVKRSFLMGAKIAIKDRVASL